MDCSAMQLVMLNLNALLINTDLPPFRKYVILELGSDTGKLDYIATLPIIYSLIRSRYLQPVERLVIIMINI